MSAAVDYPVLVAWLTGAPMTVWPNGDLAEVEVARALGEIDRLRAENAAWMNGVADAVEPLGFCREAACGPADLLPGLESLSELRRAVVAIHVASIRDLRRLP